MTSTTSLGCKNTFILGTTNALFSSYCTQTCLSISRTIISKVFRNLKFKVIASSCYKPLYFWKKEMSYIAIWNQKTFWLLTPLAKDSKWLTSARGAWNLSRCTLMFSRGSIVHQKWSWEYLTAKRWTYGPWDASWPSFIPESRSSLVTMSKNSLSILWSSVGFSQMRW